MNLNELMRKVDACDDRLQARSEDADDAYDTAYEEAGRKLTFDRLLRISAIVTGRFRFIVTDKVRQTKVCGLYINRSR